MFKKIAIALLMGASCLTWNMNPISAAPATGLDDLKNPHSGFFYIITKPVDVNIQQQMERAYNLIIEGKDYDMAIAVLDEVIKLDSENSEAYILRGMARTELKEYVKADNDYASALKIEPKNPTFYYYRAMNQLYKGYNRKTYGQYFRIGADNKSVWAYESDRLAVQYFKKAIEIEPYYIDAIVGLGDCYCSIAENSGQNDNDRIYTYRTAIGEYNKVLVLFPNHNVVLTKKADAQEAMEKVSNKK